MGFQDRGDSFDFNVAMQDHFKFVDRLIGSVSTSFFILTLRHMSNLFFSFVLLRWIKQSEKLEAEAVQPDLGPKLDLSFKEGQTIHINLGVSTV